MSVINFNSDICIFSDQIDLFSFSCTMDIKDHFSFFPYRPGELVADICAGSGTTAIASINAERRFVCFETAPAVYAAASERIRAAQAVKSSGEKGV